MSQLLCFITDVLIVPCSGSLLTAINVHSWILLASIDEELALLFTRFDFSKYLLFSSQDELEAFYAKVRLEC